MGGRIKFCLVLAIVLFQSNELSAKPKAKGRADADAGPWDWQTEHSSFPVFKPFPVNKMDLPQFLPVSRNVTATVGETAFLPCRVKNLASYTVSWIRARDVSVLSVGHLAFSSDSRIGVLQVPRPQLSSSDWNLSINKVTEEDDGLYECQVNTEPKINYKVFLTVKDPAKAAQADSPYYQVDDPTSSGYEQTHSVVKKHHKNVEKDGFSMYLHENGCICPKPEFIKHKSGKKTDRQRHHKKEDATISVLGGSIRYLTSGDEALLECVLSNHGSAPSSLHWETGGQKVSVRTRPGLSLQTERTDSVSSSILFLASTDLTDTGNYTCVSGEMSSTVLLVVTPGEQQKQSTYRSSPLVQQSTSGGLGLQMINTLSLTAFTLLFLGL